MCKRLCFILDLFVLLIFQAYSQDYILIEKQAILELQTQYSQTVQRLAILQQAQDTELRKSKEESEKSNQALLQASLELKRLKALSDNRLMQIQELKQQSIEHSNIIEQLLQKEKDLNNSIQGLINLSENQSKTIKKQKLIMTVEAVLIAVLGIAAIF